MRQEKQMGQRIEPPCYERENELLDKVWGRVFPSPQDAGGKEASDLHAWAGALIRFLEAEWLGAQDYQKMTRRYPANGGVFSRLAAEKLCCKKELAAALFLRCGVRIPQIRGQEISLNYREALRSRILAEQAVEADYRAAAQHAPDDSLRQLYWNLAGEAHRQGEILYHLLEQAM